MACNSLSFERGSQQDYHFDTFYMPPPVENKMLATWIALEDCSMEAGPLKYYPGSQKINPFLFSNNKLNAIPEEMPKFHQYIEKELNTRNLKPETFIPKKGDVLIWHAQLYHGGGAITNKKLTRKSLVTHYFRTKDFGKLSYVSLGKYQHYLKRSHQLPLKPKEEAKTSFLKKLIKKILQ